MEAVEFIFKLIIAIGCLAIFAYVMSFITGGISKTFGTTMVNSSGRVISTPTTIDENIRDLRNLKNLFVSKYLELVANNTSPLKIEEQIKLLGDLNALRQSGALTEDEFQYYKLRILSKSGQS